MTDKIGWLTAEQLAALTTNPLECADKLRKIVEDVAKHPGEFVLVVERYREMTGCAGIMAPRHIPDEYYASREDISLGVLEKDGRVKISDHLFSLAFPTGSYARAGRDEEVRAGGGNLIAGSRVMSLLYLDQPIQHQNRFDFDPTTPALTLEIRVGDEAVEAWFSPTGDEHDELFLERVRQQRAELFRKLCEKLGRPNRAMQTQLAYQRVQDQRRLTAKLDGYLRHIEEDLQEAERLGVGNTSIVRLWKKILELTPELTIDALKN